MEAETQPTMPSSLVTPRGIKKVLSNRSRTSIPDPGSETSSTQGLRKSTDSTGEHSRKDLSRKPSRNDSSQSGSSGIRKLIPGHAKRKRRRIREAAGLLQPESDSTENNIAVDTTDAPATVARNHSTMSLLQDDASSLLTDDDSEPPS